MVLLVFCMKTMDSVLDMRDEKKEGAVIYIRIHLCLCTTFPPHDAGVLL
jgi:hypothetical protein